MPTCKNCHQPIRFAKLGGRSVPVDAESNTDGGLVLFRDGLAGVLTARPARRPADQLLRRHRLHFDSCTDRRQRR